MKNVAAWKQRFEANADIITQVYAAEDITRARTDGRLGIFLGWQNSSGIDDYLPFIPLFAELGIRVIQLTYNTANAVGCGCYESEDGGLTDFGHEVVYELNRANILIDLSHVGTRTANEAIAASRTPVCFSHTLTTAHNPHPRNKSDDQLRLLAHHDGFVGATLFPAFLPHGYDSTLEDYLDAVEHLIDLLGETQVGIGTDFMLGRDEAFRRWISRDKGYGRMRINNGDGTFPHCFGTPETIFELLRSGMQQRGWRTDRIDRVLGENWLRFLAQVWTAPAPKGEPSYAREGPSENGTVETSVLARWRATTRYP